MPTTQIVECPILAPNEQAQDTATPPGRMAKLQNAVATKFENGRIKVGARDGFRQLTKRVANADVPGFGVVSLDGFAEPPTLLNSFRSQLVTVSDQHPLVLAENAPQWSRFPYKTSTRSLSQRTFYTATNSISCPDAACIANVVCNVWLQTNETTSVTTAYMSVSDVNGTPLRLPAGIADSASNAPVAVKVVQDGTYFWVFNSAGTTMQVFVLDTTGALLEQYTFATLALVEGPPNIAARWDVTCDITGVVRWFGPTATANSALYHLTFNPAGPTVTATLHDLAVPMSGVDAFGGIAWLTNDIDGNNSYLALYSYTAGVHAYSIDIPGAVNHHYTVAPANHSLDALQMAGYVDSGFSVNVMVSTQSTTPFNVTDFYHCQTNDVVTSSTRSTITLASRTFNLDGTMTNIMYYNDASGQPTFFLFDWQFGQMIGCWAHGFAAQEWQASPAGQGYLSRFNFSVPSPYVTEDGHIHFAIGFLSEQFVRGVANSKIATNGKFQVVTVDKWVSAVGLADVEIGSDGDAIEYADTLLLPGPLANDFTGSVFREDGFCLYPVSLSFTPSHSDAGNLGNGPYSYVFCWAWNDTNGNRVRSRPSDPYVVDLAGTGNNVISLTVQTLFMTNKVDVQLEIYRSFLVAGVQSAQHKKITDDLKPLLNDKASPSIHFSDNVSDTVCQLGQTLYTDDGLLPVDACPAFSAGCVAGARVFVRGFDGNVYFSNEKQPGRPLEFNVDTLLMVPPSSDPIVQCKALDSSRIVLLCEQSVWEWDITQLPGPDGLGGNIKTPTLLQGFAGCEGKSFLVSDGIVYSSKDGPWLVSRALENKFFGAPMINELSGKTIVGISQDSDQRLLIGLAGEDDKSVVRDAISGVWSTYQHPTQIVKVHEFHDRICYADMDSVFVQDKGSTADTLQVDVDIGGGVIRRDIVSTPIAMDMLSAPIQIGTVKGMKVLWDTIITGEYLGPHNLLVDFSYLTEDGTVTESFNVNPQAEGGIYGFGYYGEFIYGEGSTPQYVYEFQPIVQEVEAITIRLRTDFTGIAGSGPTFALELFSFQIGVDNKLSRVPPSLRRGQSA